MSYFWKKKGTMYHWHLHCKSVPMYVRTNPDWEVSEERPIGKEQCKDCREKDIAQRIKGKT